MSARTCFVADDHPAVRSAIATFLGDAGYEIAGTAVDGAHAIAAIAAAQPELAIVDYRMPGPAGETLVRELLAASPQTRVVVYTADGDESLARDALAAGATGVVLKDAPLADLARALEAVAAGKTYVDPGIAQHGPARRDLTGREREVLELVAAGLTHAEIGERLGISPETVRTHLRKACDRLGASTRTQAVASALRLGLIS